ncbi:MAG: hypothetical protein M1834_006215 [Cirrosporium novae-zelandiae]|nr:MAG: hypothetical protein M1834_006215 [Cirrosporium novae-zelandiae]
MPGSGQSTLMKFAMKDQRTINGLANDKRKWIIASFFFHDRGEDLQKSLYGMLKEILYQILSKEKQLYQAVYPVYADLVKATNSKFPKWSLEKLQEALLNVAEQRMIKTGICLFLDALDEHAGDNELLSDLLYKLTSKVDGTAVRLKICLASRPWTVFLNQFGACPNFEIHHHTQGDIKRYAQDRLHRAWFGRNRSTTVDQNLRELRSLVVQISRKALGVFVRVKLVLNEVVPLIRDGSKDVSELEDMVNKMPQELGQLYRRILERVEAKYANEARAILETALYSFKPLTLEGLIRSTLYIIRGKSRAMQEEAMMNVLTSRTSGLLECIHRSPDVAEATSGKSISRIVQENLRTEGMDFSEESDTNSVISIPPEYSQASTITSEELDYDISNEAQANSAESRHIEQSTITVQFIHQTAKEYVQEHQGDLGLSGPSAQISSSTAYLKLVRIGFMSLEP